MTLRLFGLPEHPNQIAVSDIDSFVVGGAFFLDFSRPLEPQRRRWYRSVHGMFVPVVHQGEHKGGYVIGVDRDDPHFDKLRALWTERYPAKRTPPTDTTEGLQIIADFARQFPNDC